MSRGYHVRLLIAGLLNFFIHQCLARTHSIDVGADGPKFTPNSLHASVGDTVVFRFRGEPHSVVRAKFEVPCTPYEAVEKDSKLGFSSGVHSSSERGYEYRHYVAGAEPVFFYSSVGNACNMSTMVGVINPRADQSITMQKYLATKVSRVFQPGDSVPLEFTARPKFEANVPVLVCGTKDGAYRCVLLWL